RAIAELLPSIEFVGLAQEGVEGLCCPVDRGGVGRHGEGSDEAHLLQGRVAARRLVQKLVILQVLGETLQHGQRLVEVHLSERDKKMKPHAIAWGFWRALADAVLHDAPQIEGVVGLVWDSSPPLGSHCDEGRGILHGVKVLSIPIFITRLFFAQPLTPSCQHIYLSWGLLSTPAPGCCAAWLAAQWSPLGGSAAPAHTAARAAISDCESLRALEVMRKRVARSLTALIFSPPSTGTFSPSSSLSERCRAAPCLAIRSLHVLRSSSLLTRIFRVPWSSLRSDWDVGSSSPELIVHHADGFGFGQLQCRDPSLPLHLCASLEVVSAAATAQDNVAGVLCVDVRRGQVDCSSASMGHLCLRPATKHQAEKETEKEHIKNCTLLFVT
ncbi:hypothetical protein F7725_012587, partial [Dissostichus mawsoni]